MANCKFFFSYARNDKSPYLDGFFEMLREEVMHKTAVKSPTEACFRDTDNIELGNRWTNELVDAIQTTNVLVCLYSPSYFISEYCGKEVCVFQSRVSEYKKAKIDIPDVILPVLWETPSTFSIPPSLKEIQYTHASIHEDYPAKGLLTFSKLSKYKDAYLFFIEQLALKIQEISKTVELPQAKIGDIVSVPNAFIADNNDNNEPTNITTSKPNAKQTRTIFVVGVKSELKAIKEEIDNYDEESEFWKPFYPDEDSIIILLQQIATEKKLKHIPIQCSEDLPAIIRDAEKNNCSVTLIVDPWSATLGKYKIPLNKYDEDRFINSAVIVIWNNNDEETNKKKKVLLENLYDSLSRCMLENTSAVKDSVKSVDELRNALSTAIDNSCAKLRKRGQPFQTIEAETTSMPLLSVSGVSNNG